MSLLVPLLLYHLLFVSNMISLCNTCLVLAYLLDELNVDLPGNVRGYRVVISAEHLRVNHLLHLVYRLLVTM